MDIETKAIHSTAWFSECHQYRYTLEREFMFGEGIANFIMLNPSTATEQYNDPTVARCEHMTLRWGYKSMIVTNIFAFRATDPQAMKLQGNAAVGLENDNAILKIAQKANQVICAWGNHGLFLERGNTVLTMLKQHHIPTFALKCNNNGQPAHPLYLRKDLELFAI